MSVCGSIPQRIKKELNLLQKLYSLYNAVLENVNGYYDILWSDIDIEKINTELLEFQNRYIVLIYQRDFANMSLYVIVFVYMTSIQNSNFIRI